MMSVFNEKFKEYLKYYFYVGGMPEAVEAFQKISRFFKENII